MNRDNAHAHLVAGDGLEAAELLGEVREADGVVEDAVGAVVVGVGPADDADDGEVLAVRAAPAMALSAL